MLYFHSLNPVFSAWLWAETDVLKVSVVNILGRGWQIFRKYIFYPEKIQGLPHLSS